MAVEKGDRGGEKPFRLCLYGSRWSGRSSDTLRRQPLAAMQRKGAAFVCQGLAIVFVDPTDLYGLRICEFGSP